MATSQGRSSQVASDMSQSPNEGRIKRHSAAGSGPIPYQEPEGQGSGGREDKEMKCLLQSQIVRVGEKDFGRKAIHFSMGQGDWIINRLENLIKSIVPFFHKCHTYHTLHLYSVFSII